MNIAIFLSSLENGGTERAAVRLAKFFADYGCSVTIVTLCDTKKDFYYIPPGVNRISVGENNGSSKIINNVNSIFGIRDVVNKFKINCVISLGDASNVMALLATVGLPCKNIISERSDPIRKNINIQWAILRKLLYWTADLHVAQSNYAKNVVKNKFFLDRQVVIGNSVDGAEKSFRAEKKSNEILKILSVGRLVEEKGYLMILACMRQLALSGINYEYNIVGDGIHRGEIEKFIIINKLTDRVKLIGQVKNVNKFYEQADIYVLGSVYEGFPNALVEAMSYGIPVVATRCPGGVVDVLCDEKIQYGFVIENFNHDEMAEAILKIAKNDQTRSFYSNLSKARAADYSESKIALKWINAVKDTIK